MFHQSQVSDAAYSIVSKPYTLGWECMGSVVSRLHITYLTQLSHVAQSHVAQGHVAQGHVAQSHVAPSHVAQSHVAPGHVAQDHV